MQPASSRHVQPIWGANRRIRSPSGGNHTAAEAKRKEENNQPKPRDSFHSSRGLASELVTCVEPAISQPWRAGHLPLTALVHLLYFAACIYRHNPAQEALVSQSRTRHRRIGTLAAATLALGLAWLGLTTAQGQDLVRKALVTSGNAQPIQLHADNIATWNEAGRRVFLLQGQVWIEQGPINLRMPQGVVWVDENAKQTSEVYNLEVYGDGGVTLD